MKIEESKNLRNTIVKIIKNLFVYDYFFSSLLQTSKHRLATVEGISGSDITVRFVDSPTTTSIVKNARNISLQAGDRVYVLMVNGSNIIRIIDFKYNY